MQFREQDIINRGVDIVSTHGFLYLAMEVRTGKTLTSLGICERLNIENVLFLTKKKAMSSISDDLDKMCPTSFTMFTINYESIHKIPKLKWDLVICDEAHSMGAFPKPNKRAKQVKDLVMRNGSMVILLSGTPTPESYSQMYHQVYGIRNNPFARYKSFYRFSDDYVNVFEKKINSNYIRDYSRGKQSILDMMAPYTISYTQKEAGFKVKITEHKVYVDMQPETYALCKRLSKDLVIEGSDQVVLVFRDSEVRVRRCHGIG